MREVGRKIEQASQASALTLNNLRTLMQRAERIRSQRPKDKNKLYALHAPEVECIGKGKARKPHEFGVKVSVAVTHKQGLMVGARNIRWLLRAIVRLGLQGLFAPLFWLLLTLASEPEKHFIAASRVSGVR